MSVKHSYYQFSSNQSISWSNFTSQFSVRFSVPASEWVKLRESFLAIRLKVAQCDADGVEKPLHPFVDSAGLINIYPYQQKSSMCIVQIDWFKSSK